MRRLLSATKPLQVQRAYAIAGPVTRELRSVPAPTLELTAPRMEASEIQRQPRDAGSSSNQPSGSASPALAAPSLALTPGNAVTRGDTLTAKADFAPTAGEKLTVTGWRFTSSVGGSVTRPAKDAGFQKEWKGPMARSGTLELSYEVKPKGGKAVPGTPVTAPITVNDRTGADWITSISDLAESPYTGGLSPPQTAESLGHHLEVQGVVPTAQDNTIAGGPNAGFTFVASVTDRKFQSQPQIHPDVTSATSVFRTFHQDAGRLYFRPTTGAHVLIPPAEYRVTSAPGARLTFTPVAGWTAFYKRHGVLAVTFSSGRTTVPAQDSWWTLDPDAEAPNVKMTNENAIRRALGTSASAPITPGVTARGQWEAIPLMPSAKIEPGTRSHEYAHAVHSHRANFHKIVRALDPRRRLEATVSTPSNPIVFGNAIQNLLTEIHKPNHEIVDEAASKAAGQFVAAPGQAMAAVNQDPSSGAFLGALWDITNDQPLSP